APARSVGVEPRCLRGDLPRVHELAVVGADGVLRGDEVHDAGELTEERQRRKGGPDVSCTGGSRDHGMLAVPGGLAAVKTTQRHRKASSNSPSTSASPASCWPCGGVESS